MKDYGIFYIAPYDASNTNFCDHYFDACISTNTLEHIPESDLHRIFTELNRTLKPGGIVSAHIDYSDHYAHTDKSISLLNFLKFDDEEWKHFNHKCHYQNRLRHYDYLRIFEDASFDIIKQELNYGEKNIPPQIIDKFRGYDESWKATSALITLIKR